MDKLGRSRVREALEVSKVAMRRPEKGLTAVDKSKLMKLLSLITPWEFEEVLVAHRYPSMLLEGFLYSVFPPNCGDGPHSRGCDYRAH
ncbi:MAG: hypothetical protein QXG17_04880 [Sulfolobales archaeon]